MHPGGAPAARDPKTPPEQLRALLSSEPGLAPMIAQHPSAPPDVLRLLAGHISPEVRRAVAENPNTPREVLFSLAPHFPAPLAKNPAIRLLWLEDPAFLTQLPKDLLFTLLDAEAPPPWLPRTWTDSLAEHHDPEVLARLAASRLASPKALERLAQRAPRLLPEIAKNPSASLALLRGLALSPVPLVRTLVAMHPKAGPALLAALLEDEHPEVRRAAVRHPAVPKKRYWLLRAAGADPSLSETRAEKRDALSLASLRALCRGGVFARCLAAQHPSVTRPLYALIAQDPHPSVRAAVLDNSRASVELFFRLVQDPSPLVRARLASHPRCPVPALERLLQDPAPEVQQQAAQHPRLPGNLLCSFVEAQGNAEILSPQGESTPNAHSLAAQLLPRAMSAVLGKTPASLADWERVLSLRPALAPLCAASPAAPGPLLARLAREGRHASALAHNPATPDAVRAEILQQEPALLSAALGVAAQLGPASLAVLVACPLLAARRVAAGHPKTPAVDLFSLAEDPADQVRLALAKNRAAPPPLLARLARDADLHTRQAAANNPNTPPEALGELLQDSAPEVRRAALRNPNAPGRLL